IINLLTARIGNLEKSLANQMAVGVYSDGTGSGSKIIGGLQLLVADAPSTGIVGGINRATSTNTFWRNKTFDATSARGPPVTTTDIQSYMNQLYVPLVRGVDKPDLIIADNDCYTAYLGSLQTIQRVTDDSMAQAGFVSLKYMNADVVLDGGA